MNNLKTFICILFLIIELLPAQDNRYTVSLINPSITSGFLRATSFFNESSGYIAGSSGSVFYTNNSGETWQDCSTPKRYMILSLFFHDEQRGWAAGGIGTEPYLPHTKNGFYFHSVDSGFTIGGYGEDAIRFLTTDGGKSWNEVNNTISEVAGKIIFPENGEKLIALKVMNQLPGC